MDRSIAHWLSLVTVLAAPVAAQAEPYYPPRGEWETRDAAAVGMSDAKLAVAVQFAKDSEAGTSRDLHDYVSTTLANEPHGEIIGPTKDRGELNGIVIRDGYIVAEWGPTRRVDMTFSVTKTYLSTVIGLAFDRKMIESVDDRVATCVTDDHFTSAQNAPITWDHLLRQTSHWRGSLWGKPDWADRPTPGLSEEELPVQPNHSPGSRYEYNDVRVNLLALAGLHVWRRPLPAVLREHVMDPIGASSTWRWHGYENSWVPLDGLSMQSVSGGGHWGGGMFISTRDHARFGYLFLRKGRWKSREIISENWIAMARTPGTANPGYGYMNWFLNQAQTRADGTTYRPYPDLPESSVTFRGAGTNVVYVDWEHDLVIVVRWIDRRKINGFVQRVLAAIDE